MGTFLHLVLLLRQLYDSSTGMVKVDSRISKTCTIRRGIRQGCVLSPLLFNIYGDYKLIAKGEREMSEFIERVEQESLKFGLKLNCQKNKTYGSRSLQQIGNRTEHP